MAIRERPRKSLHAQTTDRLPFCKSRTRSSLYFSHSHRMYSQTIARMYGGWLKYGNAPYDIRNVKRCGARNRRGGACGSPAMRNGRCRLHGGAEHRTQDARRDRADSASQDQAWALFSGGNSGASAVSRHVQGLPRGAFRSQESLLGKGQFSRRTRKLALPGAKFT
jgi:hypothetical protein